MRKFGLVLGAVAAAFAWASVAVAGPGDTVVTLTSHQHGAFLEPFATDPCNNNNPMLVSFDGNAVFHATLFFAPGVVPGPNAHPSNIWVTGTETGTATVQDYAPNTNRADPNAPFIDIPGPWSLFGPVYSGRATAWFNFNLNDRNANSTSTLTIHATAPGGAQMTGHEVMHFSLASGFVPVVSFDKATWTCG